MRKGESYIVEKPENRGARRGKVSQFSTKGKGRFESETYTC